MLAAIVLSIALMASCRLASNRQDSPEVKKLYEAAKKEGKVIVWGTQRREVEWIPAAFGAMFPGIEVQVLGDNEIAPRDQRGARRTPSGRCVLALVDRTDAAGAARPAGAQRLGAVRCREGEHCV